MEYIESLFNPFRSLALCGKRMMAYNKDIYDLKNRTGLSRCASSFTPSCMLLSRWILIYLFVSAKRLRFASLLPLLAHNSQGIPKHTKCAPLTISISSVYLYRFYICFKCLFFISRICSRGVVRSSFNFPFSFVCFPFRFSYIGRLLLQL